MEALDAIGRPDAERGSREWAIWYSGVGVNAFEAARAKVHSVQKNLGPLKRLEAYKVMSREDGKPFSSWAEFCDTRRPFGLGIGHDVVEAILAEENANRLVVAVREEVTARRMQEAEALTKHGGDRKSEEVQYQGSNRTLKPRGETADYLAARIKRDRPDIAARVEAGEFRSMRAAALEAGIVKPPCPVKAAKRAVEKMDEDQLAEFSDWLETRSSAERDY